MADVPPDMDDPASVQPSGTQLGPEESTPTVAFRVKRWANRSNRVSAQPFRPPMMAELAQAGWSEPVSGVTPSGRSAFSMLAMHDHLKAQHWKSWLNLLHTAGSHSDLFTVTKDSELASEHRVKAVSKFAPSTLSAYLRMWQQWQAFAHCHGASPYSPHATLVADFLHVHSKASNQGLAINYLKALSWVSKHAGFPDLLAILQLPLTKAYGVASNPSPRREAPPLPLSFVVWMENAILSGSGTVADRFILGGLLLMVWGSLRWSDCQWISPSSLTTDADALRGLATRTKFTARGMPFGILCSGFLGHTSHVTWVSVWMNLVREAIHRTSINHAGFVPDFIIPQVGAELDAPQFLSPMTRSQGVLLLRKFMLTADPSVAVDLIGVHSCKVTFLSWSRQLGLDEDLRRHHKHHRAPGSGWCVDLYSRDDVHPALQLQRILRSKVGAGFRPVMPVLRGAGPSVSDKPVVIPPLPASSVVDCETSIQLPQAEDHVDTDSEASADDDVAPGQSGTADVGTRQLTEGARAYRLVPFLRQWANTEERWADVMQLFKACEKACNTVVTETHWFIFAVLCSLITRVKYVSDDPSASTASLWIPRKPYPPTVVTVVAQTPLVDVEMWQNAFEKSLGMLWDWTWADSPLLDEDCRIVLRGMQSAVLDFGLLLRAAKIAKLNRCTDLTDDHLLEA
eukprot:s917_g33.t1